MLPVGHANGGRVKATMDKLYIKRLEVADDFKARLVRSLSLPVLLAFFGGFVGVAVGVLFLERYIGLLRSESVFIGAIPGTCVGMLVGLTWQVWTAERRRDTPKVTYLIVLGAAMFYAIGFYSNVRGACDVRRRVEDVHRLSSSSLKRVTATDWRDPGVVYFEVTDPTALHEFASSLADAAPHFPNHDWGPSYMLAIERDGGVLFLEVYLSTNHPDKAIGRFVRERFPSGGYSSAGTFWSGGLRDWLETRGEDPLRVERKRGPRPASDAKCGQWPFAQPIVT